MTKSILNIIETLFIKVELASSLDLIQGTIYAPNLLGVFEVYIFFKLFLQGVSKCKRFTGGKDKIPTRLLLLIFGGKSLFIKVF